jgi:hypothetical protein
MWNSLRATLERAMLEIPVSAPARSGTLPNFLIIGAQKCGTSSLFKYLSRHPRVRTASTKEVHYFDQNFHRGIRWYQAHFPRRAEMEASGGDGGRLITGEASPYYLFHPLVPLRVRERLPEVKLIVLLRNPVHRAFSQYHMEVGLGWETLPFAEALDQEKIRLDGERERLLADPRYKSADYCHYSYLARGRYADQLEEWYRYFPAEQILVLKAEDMYADPQRAVGETTEFLGLPEFTPPRFRVFNPGSYDELDPALSRRLHRYFEPAHEPESNILCFRYLPARAADDPAALDELQREVRERYNASGRGWITATMLDGRRVLRVTLMNPLTAPQHLERLLEGLRESAPE